MQSDRKVEILDAFMRLVSRFGIDKTTMQDIAKEVGISVGVIYKDFKNKEDLIEAYLNRICQQFLFYSRELVNQNLPAEQLLHDFVIHTFRYMGRLAHEDRGFWQMFQSVETIKYLHKTFDKRTAFLDDFVGLYALILQQGVDEGVFEIENVPKTARLFMDSFEVCGKGIFMQQDLEAVIQGVEEMYAFVIKAIHKGS